MSDNVNDFFEWRYHLREFYDGIIMKAQKDRPISLNFSKHASFVDDSTYFSLIMAQPSDDHGSTVSLYAACFPNKNSPTYSPTKPNKDWGKLTQKKVIPVKGEVRCCVTDNDSNIFVGSNEAIQIINENETLTKDIESPAYLVRVIPDDSMASLYCLENYDVVRYNLKSDSIDTLFSVEQPILDVSISQQDPNQLLAALGKKNIMSFDFREGIYQQLAKTPNNVTSLAFSNDHQFLYVAGFHTGAISLYDFRSPNSPLTTISAHDEAVTSIKWSPSEPDIIASASHDTSVAIWSFRHSPNGEIFNVFAHNGHAAPITAFDWCPDVPWTLASISEDNLFEVWTISPSQIEDFM